MKGKSYFSLAVCCLSLIPGAAVFLLVLLVTGELPAALLCFLGTSLLISLLVPLYFRACDRRYRDIEDDIPEEILIKEQISFSTPQSGRGGYLCVTPTALYFFSRDRKPYFSFRLPKDAVLAANTPQESALHLTVLDRGTGRATDIALLTPKSGEILELLCKDGWVYSGK